MLVTCSVFAKVLDIVGKSTWFVQEVFLIVESQLYNLSLSLSGYRERTSPQLLDQKEVNKKRRRKNNER